MDTGSNRETVIIPYHRMDELFPSRSDFIDANLGRMFEQQIASGRPVLVMPNTYNCYDDYRGRRHVIEVFGVLPSGDKICVTLTDIPLNVDVIVPSGYTYNSLRAELANRMSEQGVYSTKMSLIKMYDSRKFQKDKSSLVRVEFRLQRDREDFIKAFKSDYTLTANDTGASGYYVNKLARELKFNTGSWNRITDYTVAEFPNAGCKYTIITTVDKYKAPTPTEMAKYTAKTSLLRDSLLNIMMLEDMWDIETYSQSETGEIPTETDEYDIFMICNTFSWYGNPVPFLRVGVVNGDINPHKDIDIAIVCSSEKEVLHANMFVWGRMRPDFLAAFNGSNFDWPLYAAACERYGLRGGIRAALASTNLSSHHRDFRKETMKIDASDNYDLKCVAQFPGVLDFDVQPIFHLMYPKLEIPKRVSLNKFLELNNLPSKEDMHYRRLHKIYERRKQLQAAPKECHCREPNTGCLCCQSTIREVDCLQTAPGQWLGPPHADLLNERGEPLCCYCGKRPRNISDMTDATVYCVIDCVRPHQLLVKRSIINEKRDLANMTYVTMYQSMFRAHGGKVQNYAAARAYSLGIAMEMGNVDRPKELKEHYPGGLVLEPEYGLHIDAPISGEDVNSLYPSKIMDRNLSPDMVVTDQAEAEQLLSEGYRLHKIGPFDYEIGEKKHAPGNVRKQITGWTVRHNGIYNPQVDKYVIEYYEKHVKITYNLFGHIGELELVMRLPTEYIDTMFSADVVHTHESTYLSDNPDFAFARFLHQNGCVVGRTKKYVPVYGRAALPGERMGIFSIIMKELFDARLPIKHEYVALVAAKEKLASSGATTIEVTVNGERQEMEMSDLVVQINIIEIRQKTLKLVANMFYGKSGNFNSTMYNLLVAGGVTEGGRVNLMRMDTFVREMGFRRVYGDTDSLYLKCPARMLEYSTEAYKRGYISREQYWTAMVRTSMRAMNDLGELLSDFNIMFNGTNFINTAHEEVLQPTIICGKKKYCGIAHMKTIDFSYDHEIFIRGLELIKQGSSPILRILCEELMRKALSVNETRSLRDITVETLRKYFETKWDESMFICTARYRPAKNNQMVKTFAARMQAASKAMEDPVLKALYAPPEPGDKFEYVVVRCPQLYTDRGTMVKVARGDQMEHLRVYRHSQTTPNPMRIDLEYYVNRGLLAALARFIAYHPDFQPPDMSKYDLTNDFTSYDQYCTGKATEFLEGICAEYRDVTAVERQETGRIYQAVYRRVYKACSGDAAAKYGHSTASLIDGLDVDNYTGDGGLGDKLMGRIMEIVAEPYTLAPSAESHAREYVQYLMAGGRPLTSIHQYYNSNRGQRHQALQYINTEIRKCERTVRAMTGQIIDAAVGRRRGLRTLIEIMRRDPDREMTETDMELANNLNPEQADTLRQLDAIITRWRALIARRECVEAISKYLMDLHAKRNGVTPAISTNEIVTEARVLANEGAPL